MASFFLFQSILAPFVSFKAFPLLSVIALKILTISYFFLHIARVTKLYSN